MEDVIYNVEVSVKGDATVSAKEKEAYIDYLTKKYNRKLSKLDIETDGEYVNLSYKFADVPFERIRRITGYLVGTMDHWNDAKRAEEKDRVKHGVEHGYEAI